MIYYRTNEYVIKAAVDLSGGIMVALAVPLQVAKKLALDGGQPASDLHITLAYLGKRDEFDNDKMNTLHAIVSDIARQTAPLNITLTGYDVFPETDNGPCLHAVVGLSDALDSLHETVVEAVSSYGMPPQGRGADGPYKPHITLAYGESAAPPEVLPVTEFKAEWVRSTFGKTEGLFRLQGQPASNMMKAAWEESEHPRDEGGKFSESGGKRAGVYMTPNDVIEESTWGGEKQYVIRDPKTGKGTGQLISRPLADNEIPDTLYHMTTDEPAVRASGELHAQSDGGGMGGGNNMAGVSFTTSKADADLMQKEMRRMITTTKAVPTTAEQMKSILDGYAREDEKAGGLPKGYLDGSVEFAMNGWEGNVKTSTRDWNGKDWDTSPELPEGPERTKNMRTLAKEAFTSYLMQRDHRGRDAFPAKDFDTNDKYAPLKNPLFYGDATKLSQLDPEKVGILTVPKSDLPKHALKRAGSDKFLHEIRVHADVPVNGEVKKDGDAGSGLVISPTLDGTPTFSMNKEPRRKPIDGQVYTATTGNELPNVTGNPGIMKDGFGGGQGAGQGLTGTAAFTTADLDNGGRIAPAQGVFRKPKKFEGAIGPTYEEKDPDGNLKKSGAQFAPKMKPDAVNNMPIVAGDGEPDPERERGKRTDQHPAGITQPMTMAAYRTPPSTLTYDMIEDGVLVVRHIFYGKTDEEAQAMLDAHRKADASLDAALDGKPYKGIDIEAEIVKAVHEMKAHDAGVQPNAEDEPAKFPAIAVTSK